MEKKYIGGSVEADINMPNLFFNITIHEFEGLLFSNVTSFDKITDSKSIIQLQEIRDKFDTPEYINNSSDTAPSKRIGKIIEGYAKVRDGTIVAENIGIACMAEKCEHFGSWITKIVSM